MLWRKPIDRIEAYGGPVSMIISATDVTMPGNPIPHFRSAFKTKPSNILHVYVVNAGSGPFAVFMQTIGSVFQKAFPQSQQVIFVSSLEEAVKRIQNDNE